MSSAGPDAVEFAATFGLYLDDWQAWCLDQILGERADGSWSASQAALILPRQNGKNAVLEALELYAFYVLDEPRIIHTAHLAKTAGDHMARMVALIRSNDELDAITHPYFSNGKEALERLDTGARLEFITRGRKTARGGSIKRIIFDEALFLTDDQIQAIIPAMSAQSMDPAGAPQFIYTSSAPLPESEVLHRVRKRGMSDNAGRIFFAEWSCEKGVDPQDRDAWYASNPGMGIRISEDWVAENELPPSLSLDAFLVERLGVVIDVSAAKNVKLPADRWLLTGVAADDSLQVSAASFDVDMDGTSASLSIAAGSLQSPYVENIEFQAGAGWLPAKVVALLLAHPDLMIGCNGAGPAGAQVGPVLAAMAEADIAADRLKQFGMNEFKQACGGFYTDVLEDGADGRPRLRRPARGQGPLDVAASDASDRPLGDAWAWNRRSATVPISPLVSCTIARAMLPTFVDTSSVYTEERGMLVLG